jgi:photosystem II stability/assembly factor-like uncharacterized protein
MKTLFLGFLFLCTTIYAQDNKEALLSEGTFSGLRFRNIGPAFTSGRIADIAIHPQDERIWYVAVGSGGVWKTMNSGVTWTPIFDGENSYSTGCVIIDPNNPHTVWVGTGEDVGGRHVGFGDGIYKSTNGGKSWTNMGLKSSEHISRIIVHPENSDVVFVSAQGPLWSSGGERGLYKSTDGGASWKKVLGGNEWTGVTDLVMDPRDPDWMYAATWQRHRNVASYMGGGPGSGIHRSTDGGETWEKMTSGIPGSNLGKIGLAISPQNPDIIYAAIELDRTTGGIFMSADRGKSWTKQSSTVSGATGPHYYQELYASPHAEGRLYLMDSRTQVSEDHGRTFRRMNESGKHSDNHSLNFRDDDPDYLLIGTDGGIYESFDLAQNWRFIANLPLTQYYKVAVDDSEPFYFIYGGTQDNGSHGGPSRTDTQHGIRNADWFKTLGADGHQSATEPGNPDIMYAETQQGGLHRVDRITGEQVYIQPQPGEGEGPERFNWDAPILVSPHDPARIYFASHRVWRSDDRGDSWRPVSPDLTRDQERMELPIMGKVQSWDNPWDYNAMSEYNTITSLAESPLQEGLIYAGTDDGIIQVSVDGGQNWQRLEVGSISGIPATAFVNDIRADLFDANTVYAALDNHKFGDFKPYLIKSTNAGRSWTSISGDLPDRTLVWRLVQDHVNKELLFAATEFGIYFTIDGGRRWIKLKGDMPTISFRDVTIQRRENDLVGASFGRGFYVMDDYTPLRQVSEEVLSREATLFPVKDAWWYVPRSIVSAQGASDYAAENPPYGAVFTYYLAESLKTPEAERKEREKKLTAEGKDIPFPGWEALEEEYRQEDPLLLLTVKDQEGNIVNTLRGSTSKGFHRISWNLSHASKRGIMLDEGTQRYSFQSNGSTATPGTYTVSLSKIVDGELTELSTAQSFEVKPLYRGALERASSREMDMFRKEVEDFTTDLTATSAEMTRCREMILAMQSALGSLDERPTDLVARIYQASRTLSDLGMQMDGSGAKAQVGESGPPTIASRRSVASRGLSTTYGPTQTHRESLEIGKKELAEIKLQLAPLVYTVLPGLERDLKEAGAPWIEGQGLIRD